MQLNCQKYEWVTKFPLLQPSPFPLSHFFSFFHRSPFLTAQGENVRLFFDFVISKIHEAEKKGRVSVQKKRKREEKEEEAEEFDEY